MITIWTDGELSQDLLFNRNSKPFGHTWEEWVSKWCKWALSIPKKENPCLDITGTCCSVNQTDKNVWFLAGTFGNTKTVRRKCTMPEGRAIFFPILEKEDSFAEDIHLSKEEELIERAKNSTDKVICMEAAIDGESVRFDHLENFRARSQVFDLVFPENNVYDVKAGPTRSVCDGFWLFIKPLTNGPHTLYFKGETMLAEPYIEDHMKRTEAYSNIRSHIFKNRSFILDVSYELTILSSG